MIRSIGQTAFAGTCTDIVAPAAKPTTTTGACATAPVAAPKIAERPTYNDIRADFSARLTAIDAEYNAGRVPTNSTADFQFMSPPQKPGDVSVILDRAQAQAALGGLVASQPGLRHTMELVSLQILGPASVATDAAVTLGGLEDPQGNALPNSTLRAQQIWRLERGEWKVASVRFLMPVDDSRPVPVAASRPSITAASARAARPNARDVQQALEAEMKVIDACFNAGKVPGRVTDDFQFMTPPSGKPGEASIIIDKAQFIAFQKGFLAAQPGFRHEMKLQRVQIMDAVTAASDAMVTISGLRDPQGNPVPPANLAVYQTWRRGKDGWRVASVRFLLPVNYAPPA